VTTIISEKIIEAADLSAKQRRCLDLAKTAAIHSSVKNTQFRHGCLLMKSGAIVNIASNGDSYSSFADRFIGKNRFYATRHAEVSAILGMPSSVTSGSTAYVVRVNKRNELRNSRPCDMCLATLKFCGVTKIYYSVMDDKFGYIRI
jgi:tRNA(Arg) A34 adenosine deaminase TadA